MPALATPTKIVKKSRRKTSVNTFRKKRIQVKRMTESRRIDELIAFVDLCFLRMKEDDNKEICNRTGLSITTIKRLQNSEFSLCVRWGTIQALGIAAGLRFEQTEYGCQVVLIK